MTKDDVRVAGCGFQRTEVGDRQLQIKSAKNLKVYQKAYVLAM
jgi:hypothetical protein